jgi:hypothetical protein
MWGIESPGGRLEAIQNNLRVSTNQILTHRLVTLQEVVLHIWVFRHG